MKNKIEKSKEMKAVTFSTNPFGKANRGSLNMVIDSVLLVPFSWK